MVKLVVATSGKRVNYTFYSCIQVSDQSDFDHSGADLSSASIVALGWLVMRWRSLKGVLGGYSRIYLQSLSGL